jgi:HAD superfamily hydrolase (TIGR01509 family)
MLRAIIFDCDGVIADTEPIHMAAFGRVLAEEGITLTKDDYFRHYLALDDRACFIRALSERGESRTQNEVNDLITRKSEYVEPAMQADLSILPGAEQLIRSAAENYPLAVASGALRREIEMVLKQGGLRDCFRVIVSAEDVSRSKPHPDPFIRACDLLNSLSGQRIEPGQCLVVEDSIHGVRAAHLAGMRCLAVTNSYSHQQLSEADHVVASLADFSLDEIERMFSSRSTL